MGDTDYHNVAQIWLREGLEDHFAQVDAYIALGPNRKRLATASWDKTVNLWDLATDQETLTQASIGWSPTVTASSPAFLRPFRPIPRVVIQEKTCRLVRDLENLVHVAVQIKGIQGHEKSPAKT